MTPVMFAYKCVRKIWLVLLYKPYCHFATLLMMHSNNVRHGVFQTNGIPIINIDSKNGGKIIIGNNLCMNNGNATNNIGFASRCTLSAAGGATLCIGENVGMSQTALCAVDADIIIGGNTLLGGGVKIYSSDFHSLSYMDRRDPESTDKNNRKSASVVIGDDCFIGAGTIILKGVTIGARTIIGAGSVVTKSIPDDCIAAGNPCEIVKRVDVGSLSK